MSAGANSRAGFPVEHLEVDEYPTTCAHCGARTEQIGRFTVPNQEVRIERCLHCKQEYNVTDEEEEIDVVDEVTGEVVGRTAGPRPPGMGPRDLDNILLELGGELPPDWESNLEPEAATNLPDQWGSF